MKVHIFKNEDIYTLSLLNFLGRNFDLRDHLFIIRSKSANKNISFGSARVICMPGLRNLFKLKQVLANSERIYFHLLPIGPEIFYWYVNRKLFSKAVWIYWGADVYAHRKRRKSLKHYIYHILLKKIIRAIPDIAGFLKGDFELIQNVYQSTADYHHVIYPIPTNFDLCDKIYQNKKTTVKERINILLGNSGNESNHHLEAMNLLEKFRNEDILILCPLSYGEKNKSYTSNVIQKGHAIFGDKFEPLMQFIAPDEYLSLLNNVDVAVMNHDRQQGLGNTLSLLYLGKKVFLRQDTTSNDYFVGMNIKVFDVCNISKISIKEFASFLPSDSQNNRDILKSAFSENSFIQNWKNILEL